MVSPAGMFIQVATSSIVFNTSRCLKDENYHDAVSGKVYTRNLAEVMSWLLVHLLQDARAFFVLPPLRMSRKILSTEGSGRHATLSAANKVAS